MSPIPRTRRRRLSVLTALCLAAATVASTLGANPAGAATASLVTTDGIGIRIDENALNGPALQAIEDELQPWVNDRIYQGALENSLMDNPDWVQGTADLELSIDFIAAGSPGYPQGGLKVRADLNDIMMRFYRYGAWWQPECQFRVNPDNGWIDITAKVDSSRLPGAPLTIEPASAWWDDDPNITREKGNFLCTGYLLDEWWDGLWGNGTDVAADLEAEMDEVAQDLIDDLWTDYVVPVVDSLDAFGISFNQIRTDDHGLIVTANVDASGGIEIPGLGGPFYVADTPDSGATSNVNTVLAARSEVTVTIHPNVAAQFLNALNQGLYTEWGFLAADPSIENILLPPAVRDNYDDNGWYLRYQVTASPSVTPTGPGGRPVVNLPGISMEIGNSSYTGGPVATFTGTLSGLKLVTEVRPGASVWGPSIYATDAVLSNVVRTQANGDALTPSASQLQPFARSHWDEGSSFMFDYFVSLPPVSVGGLPISLCTACTRVGGDQRYTEFFNVA